MKTRATIITVILLASTLSLAFNVVQQPLATGSPEELAVDAYTLALWHFNEGEGQIVHDASPHDNDGTLGPTSNIEPRDPSWTTGFTGQPGDYALDLVDWYDYAMIPDNPDDSLDLLCSDQFTIEFWTYVRHISRPDRGNGNHWNMWIAKRMYDEPGYVITQALRFGDSYLNAFFYDGAFHTISCQPTPTYQWVHLMFTYDGQYLRLYFNDVLQAVKEIGHHYVVGNSRPLSIGKSLTSDVPWGDAIDGIIDEVRLSSIARVPRLITKTLSSSEGYLGDSVHVTVEVSVPLGETATVVDTLPGGFDYVVGTFMMDGVSTIPTSDDHDLIYTLTELGSHTIEFEVKVNKARSWEDTTVCNVATATWYLDGEIVNEKEDTACFTIHPFEALRKKVCVELLENGGFEDGLTGWRNVFSGTGYKSATVVYNGSLHADALEYHRWNCGASGGTCGVAQDLDILVSDYTELRVELDAKVISNSLTNSGWWSYYYGGYGEWPAKVQITYEDASGTAWNWIHAFFPSDNNEYYGRTEFEYVTRNSWVHYLSPNLVDMVTTKTGPYNQPISSPPPHRITGIFVGGNGWSFRGRIDNVRLCGCTTSLTIKEETEVQWPLKIEVTNPFPYTMTDAVITDRFGAEIEINEPFPVSITHGTADYTTKGKSDKVFLTWEIGDLLPSETATLTLLVSTDINPGGEQEYSEPGIYELNSGATLKFVDPEQDVQLSAYTDSIYVTVLPAEDP